MRNEKLKGKQTKRNKQRKRKIKFFAFYTSPLDIAAQLMATTLKTCEELQYYVAFI